MAEYPSLVVEHATDKPAIDLAIAAYLAGILDRSNSGPSITFTRLRDHDMGFSQSDCWIHASADGALLPNGFFWADRSLTGSVSATSDQVLRDSGKAKGPEIISLNPLVFSSWGSEALRRGIHERSRNALWVTVKESEGVYEAVLGEKEMSEATRIGSWTRDSYGRLEVRSFDYTPVLRHFGINTALVPPLCPVKGTSATKPHLVVVGEVANLREVYPAVLASIGDAADQVGVAPAIQIISPHELDASWLEVLEKVDGLILPGGNDLSQVPGQILAADAAMKLRIPLLGFCLGMQSISMAVARFRLGLADANFEDARPHPKTRAFVRLPRQESETPRHRVGAHKIRISPRSKIADAYKAFEASERMNHFYHLSPALIPELERVGLHVTAKSSDGDIADGVELVSEDFCIGLQGHPELSSRTDRPHPLFVSFLQCVLK